MSKKSDDLAPPTPRSGAATDGSAPVPCRVCGADEPPDTQGLCPTKSCRSFRVGNGAAVVHTARAKLTATDMGARDALIEELLAERGDHVDVLTRIKIVDCATATVSLRRVSERLAEVGPTTTAGRTRSLVPIYAALSGRVEKLSADLRRPEGAAKPDAVTEVRRVIVHSRQGAMCPATERMAAALRARQAAGEELAEREQGQLEALASVWPDDFWPGDRRSTE